jgi:arylsulfate sulfotransferase
MDHRESAHTRALLGNARLSKLLRPNIFRSLESWPGKHATGQPVSAFFQFAIALTSVCLLASCGGERTARGNVTPSAHPLVAQYSVESHTTGQVFVEFGTDTTYGRQTATYDVLAGGTVLIQVAGMKPSTVYHMRANLQANGEIVWKDHDRVFTTGAMGPTPPPAITVTRGNSSTGSHEDGGVELIAFFGPTGSPAALQTFVTDRDGHTIWYYDPPGRVPSFMKLLTNGHFLVALSGSDTQPSAIREIDLAGNTIRELDSNTLTESLHSNSFAIDFQFFHHDFVPLDNGHVIVLGQTTKDFTDLSGFPGTTTVQGDVLVDLDQNWNPVWAWNAFDYLDVNRHLMGLPDWTHANAVVYNPADGNLMLSMRHQSWIIGIDYNHGTGSGNVLWRLGQEGDFSLAGGDPSQWFYAEHFPVIMNSSGSAATLAVFDNGNLRINDQGVACGQPPAPACFTRAAIFQIDQSTMQAQLQWHFVPGFFSFWGGAINPLPNGNVEFEMSEPFPIPALGSRAMEVTQTASPEIVWQMDIAGGFSYRTYRIPSLYPNVSWP